MKIAYAILIEIRNDQLPLFVDTYVSSEDGKLYINNELLWDLHGGSHKILRETLQVEGRTLVEQVND